MENINADVACERVNVGGLVFNARKEYIKY